MRATLAGSLGSVSRQSQLCVLTAVTGKIQSAGRSPQSHLHGLRDWSQILEALKSKPSFKRCAEVKIFQGLVQDLACSLNV